MLKEISNIKKLPSNSFTFKELLDDVVFQMEDIKEDTKLSELLMIIVTEEGRLEFRANTKKINSIWEVIGILEITKSAILEEYA